MPSPPIVALPPLLPAAERKAPARPRRRARREVRRRPEGWARYPLGWVDITTAVLAAAAGLLARVPLITQAETLLHRDEAVVGLMALDIAEGARLPIFFYGQGYMGALEAYVVAALRGLVDDPVAALHLGPALFFAALVAVLCLMLTRWFGRTSGVVGALTLVASGPMFAYWSTTARGGYVEILLWGTLIWWAYSEWFVPPVPVRRQILHKAVLGFLIGSGLWINPMVLSFVAPIVVHALLNRPLATLYRQPRAMKVLHRLDRTVRGWPIALPMAATLLVLAVTAMSSVSVDNGVAHRTALFGLLPPWLGRAVVGSVLAAALWLLIRRTRVLQHLRPWLNSAGPFVLGALAGLTPTVIYVLGRKLSGRPLDESLPLGLRPLWHIGETLSHVVCGLPLLFGADPGRFCTFLTDRTSYALTPPTPAWSSVLASLDWLVAAGLIFAAVVLLRRYQQPLSRVFRLQAAVHPPVVLLVLALFGMLAMYVLGGCPVDLTNIRYLVPLWVVMAGLLAAACAPGAHRRLAIPAAVVLAVAWGGGQAAFAARLGRPHPLTEVAGALEDREVEFALAEFSHAHILSFLTEQRVRVGEHEPFWPRLAHYRAFEQPGTAVSYVVAPEHSDRTDQWVSSGWPGPPPPETARYLRRQLERVLRDEPERVTARESLAAGYELWTLSRPLTGD